MGQGRLIAIVLAVLAILAVTAMVLVVLVVLSRSSTASVVLVVLAWTTIASVVLSRTAVVLVEAGAMVAVASVVARAMAGCRLDGGHERERVEASAKESGVVLEKRIASPCVPEQAADLLVPEHDLECTCPHGFLCLMRFTFFSFLIR